MRIRFPFPSTEISRVSLKYFRCRRRVLIPASFNKTTHGKLDPSRMGTSRLSISIIALSISMLYKALSKCSVVEIKTPCRIKLVA